MALLVFATVSIQVRMEIPNRLSLRDAFAIMIGVIGVVELFWLRYTR
jgi:hypothetical protein